MWLKPVGNLLPIQIKEVRQPFVCAGSASRIQPTEDQFWSIALPALQTCTCGTPRIQRAVSTVPFYIQGLSIHRFCYSWGPGTSTPQILRDDHIDVGGIHCHISSKIIKETRIFSFYVAFNLEAHRGCEAPDTGLQAERGGRRKGPKGRVSQPSQSAWRSLPESPPIPSAASHWPPEGLWETTVFV